MSALAGWMARITWWWMLWFMRRPWMRRLQRRWLQWIPEHKREAAWRSVVEQNWLARKYGLKMLTLSFNVLLGSIIITWSYMLLLHMQEQGYLSPLDQDRLQARVWKL